VRTALHSLGERIAELGHATGGATELFEPIGRHQFAKLIECGLLPESHVLDIGCGCLRGGYWLIHFLRPGRYCGIEPKREMLEAGIETLLAPEVLAEKQPRCDHNNQFDLGVFGQRFDFFLARSIWSHASLRQIGDMLDQFLVWGSESSVFLTSYIRALKLEAEYTGEGFSWPAVRYRSETLHAVIRERGLELVVRAPGTGQESVTEYGTTTGRRPAGSSCGSRGSGLMRAGRGRPKE
jgi:SAM-dependent methyltransferase